MEHLSEACLGKENSDLVNSLAEAKAPPAKLPRLEQNGSPLSRVRLGSTGAKLAGVPYKPTSHLLKSCHKRGKRKLGCLNLTQKMNFYLAVVIT